MKPVNTALITGLSFASMFFLGVGVTVVGAAAPDAGLSVSTIGMLQSVQNAGFLISVILFGYLSDRCRKPLLLAAGGFFLSAGFLFLFSTPLLYINMALMCFIGIGSGSYEGVTDVLLMEIHEHRKSLVININHLFVTIGSVVITAYLIFLTGNWRLPLIQSGSAVLVFSLVFTVFRGKGSVQTPLQRKSGIPATEDRRSIVILFLCLLLVMGVQAGSIGILPTFLIAFRGFTPVMAKVGLILYFAGIVAGRLVIGLFVKDRRIEAVILLMLALSSVAFAFLYYVGISGFVLPILFLSGLTLSVLMPLIVTLTGLLFPDRAGTALGLVKLGIPAGGIVVPFAVSALSRLSGDYVSMSVFPAACLIGFFLFLFGRRGLKECKRARSAVPSKDAR